MEVRKLNLMQNTKANKLLGCKMFPLQIKYIHLHLQCMVQEVIRGYYKRYRFAFTYSSLEDIFFMELEECKAASSYWKSLSQHLGAL